MKKNLIYGIRAIQEALEANKEIDRILLKRGTDMRIFKELKETLRQKMIPYQVVPEQKLDFICPARNHQGVIAFVSSVIYQPIEEIVQRCYEEGRDPLFVLLDGVTDVRNMGAIARSAECFGADALILPMQGSARVDADAVKTSAGALNHIPVCRSSNIFDTIFYLQNCGISVIAGTDKATVPYHGIDYDIPLCLILGSEGDGISAGILADVDFKAMIPMWGKIGSLNVSVAAGIFLSEIARQRHS